MLVSKISFTSESNVSNKGYQKVSLKGFKSVHSEPVKSNQVRNWSIGLGASAVLVGLGVLGRRGNLGEGVQKLLGGIKNKVPEAVEAVETKVNDAVNETIGAGLDRTLFKLEAPVKTNIPYVKYLVNEIRGKNISDYKTKVFDKNSGNEILIEAKLINKEFLELKMESEEFSFRGKDLTRYALNKNGKVYNYNGQGELIYVLDSDMNGKVTRIINFENGTDNVRNIVHIDPESGKIIKQDVFKNAEVVREVLY